MLPVRVDAPGAGDRAPRVGKNAPYPQRYYVYQLIDPRTDLPFYVGKGRRGRAWQHERLVAAGDFSGNARKVERIKEILRAGYGVQVRIVAEYDLESDALDHEFRLVDADPTLTNVMPGGGGKQPSFLLEMRRKRLEGLREKERQARLRFRAEERIQAWGVKERHRDEVAAWVAEIGGDRSLVHLNYNKPLVVQKRRRRDHLRKKAGVR